MAMALRKRYTGKDFDSFPDDGNRHEILAGEWVTTPAPGWDHQQLLANLSRLLGDWIEAKGLGHLAFAPLAVHLSRSTVVQPDLIFISAARASRIRPDGVHGAPDLVVEVLSPSTAHLDRTRKRDLYAASGVCEYWIVDLEDRSMLVEENVPAPRLRVLNESGTLESRLFPGLRIRLKALFRPL
jgi:Uma2 family endonuclease